MFASVPTQSLGTLFSSPDYWRDLAGPVVSLDFFHESIRLSVQPIFRWRDCARGTNVLVVGSV